MAIQQDHLTPESQPEREVTEVSPVVHGDRQRMGRLLGRGLAYVGLAAAAVIGGKLLTDSDSGSRQPVDAVDPDSPGATNPTVVSSSTTEAVAPPATGEVAETPFPYAVETYIKDNFFAFAQANNVTVLDGVSLISYRTGDSNALYQENPAVAVVTMSTPNDATVGFNYDGAPLDSNQTMVFITKRPDGIIDIMQPAYITDVYVEDSYSGVTSRLAPEGSHFIYGTPAGTTFETSSAFIEGDNIAQRLADLRSEDGRDQSTNITDMLAVALG